MAIYKYNKDWQQLYGLRTKPEPWLHIVTQSYKVDNPGTHKERAARQEPIVMQYAIYVWDTRQVIEAGKVPVKNWIGLGLMTAGKRGIRAKDNKAPLVGLPEDSLLRYEFNR